MSLSTSFFQTPPTNNVNTYIGGIPASIVAPDSGREILQSYDNIYDTNSAVQQQLRTVQNQLVDLRNQILSLQYSKSSQVIADAVNWIANGDCSQFTLSQPVVGTCNAGANNKGFILNGRAIPIMDRWYHVMEGAGFNCTNLKMEAKQVNILSYISGTPAYGTYPVTTNKALSVKWYNPTNTTKCFTPETSNNNRYGGMIAVQHIIPNINAFVSTTFRLGFWIYASKSSKGYVRILRQYNTTQKGGTSLDLIKIQSFDVGPSWTYVTMSITFPVLTSGKTLNLEQSGCVVQIGPAYYNWTSNSTYGSMDPFTTSTPGIEFVIAEVQMRSDVASLDGLSFPTNLREDERTLKYVTYVAPAKPSTLSLSSYNPVTISLGFMRYWSEFLQDYYFPLRFSSRLVSRPSMIFYCFKAPSEQGIGMRWNNTSNIYNSGNSSVDMWDTIRPSGLDMLNTFYYMQNSSGGPAFEYDITRCNNMRQSGGNANCSDGVQITSLSESEMIFKTRVSMVQYDDYAFTGGQPGYTSLIINRTTDYGWFAAIVPECDTGAYGNQTQVLSYIDFSFTAPTSLPL